MKLFLFNTFSYQSIFHSFENDNHFHQGLLSLKMGLEGFDQVLHSSKDCFLKFHIIVLKQKQKYLTCYYNSPYLYVSWSQWKHNLTQYL